jgi:hypothetical protein
MKDCSTEEIRSNEGLNTLLSRLGAFGVLLSCFLIFSAGCAAQKESGITEKSVSVTTGGYFIQAAEDILLGMNFDIDKADTKNGYLRTRPLPGGQFFEFWRQDNAGMENWLLSNIHSIRRTVEIKVIEKNKQISLDCIVHIQRLSMPSREVNSAARAYEMFSQNGPLMQRLKLGAQQAADMAWIDLGRDTPLEAEILKRIKGQIAKYTVNSNLTIEESGGV